MIAPPAISAPPARGDNPFATCWTRPGALPFVAHENVGVESVLAAWQRHGRRGQIVGPHGVGKSTLLVAIGDALAEQGWTTQHLVYRSGVAQQKRPNFPTNEHGVLLVDGLEQLSRWRRWRLLRSCAANRVGVLATTHHPLGRLPALATLTPSLPLVLQLFEHLTRERPTRVTVEMVAEAFAREAGDVRATWFRLYDLHESMTPTA